MSEIGNETGSRLSPGDAQRTGVRFAGYAAIFGRPDAGGDVIRAGAFKAALERGQEIPLLWQHKTGSVLGRIDHLSEDSRGLRVIATIGSSEDGRRAARLLESGKVNGLSFGYLVREAFIQGDHRELVELDLVEVSMVAHPMQPKARVHAVD